MNTYIDFYKVNDLKLNDFNGFDKILFTEEELTMEPEERWKKFYGFAPDKKLIVYVPFNPMTLKEYQLCHYVMWSCIGYVKSDKKPYIRDFNSRDYLYPGPIHRCYACGWDIKTAMEKRQESDFVSYRCEFCPIWTNLLNYTCQCEYESEFSRLKKNKKYSDYNEWRKLYYIKPVYCEKGWVEDEDIILQNKKIGEKIKELALKVAHYSWIDKT